jgi:hypothetical protein
VCVRFIPYIVYVFSSSFFQRNTETDLKDKENKQIELFEDTQFDERQSWYLVENDNDDRRHNLRLRT